MDLGLLLGMIYLAAGGFVCLLGLVIFRENPSQQLNRVAALMLSLGGVGALLGATDFLVGSFRPAGTVLFGELVRNFAYLWEFFFPALVLFAATYPQPRAWLLRRRYLAWVLFLPHGFHLAFLVWGSLTGGEFGIHHLVKFAPVMQSPLAVLEVALKLAYRIHKFLFAYVNLAYAVTAGVMLWRSYRRTRNPRLAVQIRGITRGLSASIVLYIAAVPVPALLGQELPRMVQTSLVVCGLLAGSASIAYAIVRHRFLETRIIARRTILYGVVTLLVVVAYLTVVKPIGDFATRFTGSQTAIFETLFFVVTLLLFQPLVGRLEESVDRRLLGDRGDHRRVLEALSRDVVTILDRRELAPRIVSSLAEGLLASRAALVAREEHGGFRVLASVGDGIVSGADPGDTRSLIAEPLGELVSRIPPGRTGVLRPEDLFEFFGDGEDEAWTRVTLALMGTELMVPLRHGEDLQGLLLLGAKITATRYSTAEIVLLETLGNQTAVALKNASLYGESLARAAMEEELAVARQIQQATLPSNIPALGPLEVCGLNIPSRQVGGDYFDVIKLPDGRVMVAIADVSGKGVPAALLMAMIQASLRTQADESRPPREIVSRLNRLVCASTTSDRFATLFLGIIDPGELVLTFTNAGHDPPVLRRADGEIAFCHEGGLLLGVLDDADYEEASIPLAPGDRLVLYTDGVTETRNGADEEFGPAGLVALLQQMECAEAPRATLDRLVSSVRDFAGGEEFADDLTLLVLAVGMNGVAGMHAPAREASASVAG